MAFILSPAVSVTESDITNIVPQIATTPGAYAGRFTWGPVEKKSLMTDENKLVERFLEPNSDNFKDFFTVANFLQYGGAAWVVRVVGLRALSISGSEVVAPSRNAVTREVGSTTPSPILIKNSDDYDVLVNQSGSVILAGTGADFIAKYPGVTGNTLKVSVVDASGFDGWAYKTAVGGKPDAGEFHIVVVDEDGLFAGTAGAVLEKFEFVTATAGQFYSDGRSSYYVDVVNFQSKYIWVGDQTNGTAAFESVSQNFDDQTNVSVLTVSAFSFRKKDELSVTVAGKGLAQSLFNVGVAEGDISDLELAATSSNTGLLPNANIFFGGAATSGAKNLVVRPTTDNTGFTAVKVSVTDTGKSPNKVSYEAFIYKVVDPATPVVGDVPVISNVQSRKIEKNMSSGAISITVTNTVGSITSVTAVSDNQAVVTDAALASGLSNLGGGVYSLTFTPVTAATGQAVITITATDSDGNQAKEAFVADVIDPGAEAFANYISDYPDISMLSNLQSNKNVDASSDFLVAAKEKTAAGREPNKIYFTSAQSGDIVVTKVYNKSFDGGWEQTPNDGEIISGYELFQDADEVDVALVMAGPNNVLQSTQAIINLAEARKDCIALLSPEFTDVVANVGNELDSIIGYRDTLPSTSYGVLDSGWKLQYDQYNDQLRYVPLNGDVAGLIARTDLIADPWFSPAGFNRGQIKNVIKLPYNPTAKAERDELYKKGINPVLTTRGEGTILYGDKTMLSKPSAFDRINVRRLFIVLEKSIATAAKFFLFEQNDEFTRQQFRNMVEPFLRDVQGRRGIQDFRVVCDETNNTGQVIDQNRFVASIFIKPTRSINFIELNFVAVGTDVSFEEVLDA